MPNAINHDDLPCSITPIYYHPGLNAIMYLMDNKQTIVIKQDRSIGANADICVEKFLDPTHVIGQYSFNLATLIDTNLNFKVNQFLDNWIFLNG